MVTIDFDDEGVPYVNGVQAKDSGGGVSYMYRCGEYWVKFGRQAEAEAYAWERMTPKQRTYFAPILVHGHSMTGKGYYVVKAHVPRPSDHTPADDIPMKTIKLIRRVCKKLHIQVWDITGKEEYDECTRRYGSNWWLQENGDPIIIDWGFNEDVNPNWHHAKGWHWRNILAKGA